MRGEFRRPAVFGLVGVFVVAGIAIAIALSADSSNSDPKLQMGLIFGVIAVFFVGLFIFQRRNLNRAATGDLRGFSKGAPGGRRSDDAGGWGALGGARRSPDRR